jgi:hypothetical protein
MEALPFMPQGLLYGLRSFGGAGFEDQPAQRCIFQYRPANQVAGETQGCKNG